MKPSPWPIAVLVVVVLLALWWFWPRDKAAAPASADATKSAPVAQASPASPASSASTGAATTAASAEAAAPAASQATAAGTAASTAPVAVAAVAAVPVAATAAAPAKAEETLVAKLYFDFDRSALRAAESPKLDALAAKLKDRKYARIDIVGHADRLGEAPHNDLLSRKRADAAAAYLASRGIDAARSHAEGKGESDTAIAEGCKGLGPESGDNEKLVACLQEDRRVDVAVVVE